MTICRYCKNTFEASTVRQRVCKTCRESRDADEIKKQEHLGIKKCIEALRSEEAIRLGYFPGGRLIHGDSMGVVLADFLEQKFLEENKK